MSTSARTANGDLQVPRVIVTSFNQVVLQAVRDMFGLWQTEWFLDLNAGFPWIRILGHKALSGAEASALIRQALLAVPGIVSVVASATFNRVARAFQYNFAAKLNSGATVTGGSATPFVVTGSP